MRHITSSKIRTILFGSALCMGALVSFSCGEPAEISGGAPGDPDIQQGVSDVMEPADDFYVDTSDSIQAFSFDQELLKQELANNEGVLELRPGFEFNAVRLQLFVQAFPGIEIARETMDGRLSKFETLEELAKQETYVVDESGEILGELFFPGPMQAIYIRFPFEEATLGPQGEDAVDYLDARFFAEASPDQPLPYHLDDFEHGYESDGEEGLLYPEDYQFAEGSFLSLIQAVHVPGPWSPSQSVINRAYAQYVPYEGSPSRPAGGLLPGTRALGEYLKSRYPGIRSYGGYSARRKNVAGGSNEWSVHAAGRALDLMIPMSRPSVCGANNTVGDEVAAWLVNNTEYVGVTYMIWDNTQYSAGRRSNKIRAYRGGNCTQDHADHIHVEISSAAANRRTPFFGNMGGAQGGGGGTPAAVTCSSATLNRSVPQNTCVQQDSGKGCGWFKCTDYNSYTRLANSSGCDGNMTFGHATCGASPTPTPSFTCPSATLGRDVSENTCVQQASSRGCGWFKCTSPGSYSRLTDSSSCDDSATFNHSTCPMSMPESGRRNQLVITMTWSERVDLDINVEEPSGRLISYSRSDRSPNDGNLSLCDPTNPNRACASLSTFSETIVWGEVAGRVTPGTYDISVRNFDEPNSASYTIKAELYDGSGNKQEIGSFNGTSTTYRGMSVGQVTVP